MAQEVGPAQACFFQRSLPAPGLDLFMVSGEKNLGDFHPSKITGPGILGIIQPPLKKRIMPDRFFLADDTGDKPGRGIDDHHGRQLPSGQNIIADGNLICRKMFAHPLIDALIAPADEDDLGTAGHLLGQAEIQLPSLGGEEVNRGLRGFAYVFDSEKNRLGFEDHALFSPIRAVVHLPVLIRSKVSQIVHLNLDQAFLKRSF